MDMTCQHCLLGLLTSHNKPCVCVPLAESPIELQTWFQRAQVVCQMSPVAFHLIPLDPHASFQLLTVWKVVEVSHANQLFCMTTNLSDFRLGPLVSIMCSDCRRLGRDAPELSGLLLGHSIFGRAT